MILLFFIIFNFGILRASCGKSTTLTFVIDDTRSMDGVINQVRSQVDGILDVVHKTNEIDKIVLITFNDPGARVWNRTRDRDELKSSLRSIKLHNYDNYDCPEYSLTGIELALFESKPGSYIYVFTDASAKDHYKVDKIKDLCQKTQSQVIFVLTGNCRNPNSEKYKVYFDVATASSGLVMEVREGEVNLVLKTIGAFIEGKRNPVTSVVIPAYTSSEVPFKVDEKTQSIIISATGKNVKTTLRGPRIKEEKLIWTRNCKIVRLNNPEPGDYRINVKGSSSTYVVVYGRTDFQFQHGFSELIPKTIEDTTRQPIANEENYLSIDVNDPDDSVIVESVQILTMDEKVVTDEFSLREIKEDFYVTEGFVPPERMFKIAVNGKVALTGNPIRRIAKTPIQPQIVIKPDHKKPRVTISEAPIAKAIYGSELILTCKVNGYPDPKITWVDEDGNTLPSNSTSLEKPYDFISYLHLNKITQEKTYTCEAENHLGCDSDIVDVKIRDPFKVLQHPEETTLIEYGKSMTLKCVITSNSKMKINWYFNNKTNTKKIYNSEAYAISPNGTELVIKSMNKNLLGTYTCNAELLSDGHINKKFSTEVAMYGFDAPRIHKTTSSINVQDNKSVLIPCPVLIGIPKPEIKWQFKDNGRFVDVDPTRTRVTDENGLYISQTRLQDARTYKCIAKNIAGTDEHVTTLVVYKKPEIQIVDGKDINVKYDGQVKIQCRVTSYPTPTISWRYGNGTEVLSYHADKIINQFESSSTIDLTNLKRSIRIYCNANNSQGDGLEPIDVIVGEPFKVVSHPGGAQNVTFGEKINIPCNITSELPMQITWYFAEKAKDEPITVLPSYKYSLTSDRRMLTIPSVDFELLGKYTCEASLLADENEKIQYDTTLQLQGLKKPKIDVPIAVNVKEGMIAEINCGILEGYPKPNITWQFQKRGTDAIKPMIGTGEVLKIPNVNLEDFGDYSCIAENPLGRDMKRTKLIVEKAPEVKIIEGGRIELPYGGKHVLTCKVVAYPPPKIIWTDDKGIPIFRAEKPEENNDHTYEYIIEISVMLRSVHMNCSAENIHGDATDSVDVVVESPFKIQEKPETNASVDYGEAHKIKCHITSPLKMKINWYRIPDIKGRRMLIRPSEIYSISPDETELTINYMDTGRSGRYKCRASLVDNDRESISFDTNVQLSGLAPPKIDKSISVIKATTGTNVKINCSLLSGTPKPAIKWFYQSSLHSDRQPINGTDENFPISNIELINAGYYLCEAENIRGKDQHTTKLIVEEVPYISKSNAFLNAKENTPVTIPCTILRGVPKPKVKWQFNDKDTFVDLDPKKIREQDNGYQIPHAQIQESGLYKCIAENDAGTDDHIISLGVYKKPAVNIVQGTEINVNYGDDAKIQCNVIGYPDPTIIWRHENGTELLSSPVSGSANQFKHSNILELSNLKRSMKLYCNSSNSEGDDAQAINVIVGEPFEVVTAPEETINANYGEELNLSCNIKSVLPMKITWYYMKEDKDEKATVLPSDKYSLASNGTLLKIHSVDLDTLGKYTCEASLLSDENEKKCFDSKVKVEGLKKPRIEKLPIASKVKENSPAEIECRILEGYPKPNITWKFMKQGTDLFMPITTVGEILRIPNANQNDVGLYQCTADNPLGQDVKVKALIVERAPMITIVEGKTLNVSYGANYSLICKVWARPPPKILWTEDNGMIVLSAKTPLLNYNDVYEFGIQLSNIKNSKRLSCSAENVHGEATESIDVVVESPFIVKEKPEAVVNIDYGKAKTIKCHISSSLNMKINWYRLPNLEGRQVLIRSSEKSPYSISADETELTINHMDTGLSGRYKCKAFLVDNDKESISFDTNVQISGLAAPEIDKSTKTKKVKENTNETISCSIIKGTPKPNIKWYYQNDTDSEPQAINGTDEILPLSDIELNDAGFYTCVAENIRGKDMHSTDLVVEAPPKIKRDADTTSYNAVVGDVVLLLQCNATGFPKPVIKWKVEDRDITPGSKYSIVDGALLVHTPIEKDTLEYTCIAENSLGTDNATFDGVVTSEVTDYEKVRYIHLEEGESKKIYCLLPFSSTDRLMWFNDDGLMKNTEPYVNIVNANPKMNGNYSCRVSNERGYSMETYIVDVGYPPSFKFYPELEIDWDGEGSLDCRVDAIPEATVKWFYKRKPMEANEDDMELPIKKFGQYNCIVTNVHGSVRRSFNVTSSDCIINRRDQSNKKSPLMLTNHLEWPQYKTKTDFLIIPNQDKLILSCQGYEGKPNSFTMFAEKNKLEATCAGDDTFWIDGKLYGYSELQCGHEISPSVNRTGKQCIGKNTEMIQVGYELDKFVEVYRVCYDTNANLPLYSEVLMISANNLVLPPDSNWFESLSVPPGDDSVYNCEKSAHSCCIGKEQLVSGNDVMFGPARRSTFIENLNSIPVWSHCHNTRSNWSSMENIIRSQYISSPEFQVWSGVAKYIKNDGRNIPQYLWKVVRFNEDESLAIIHVNDPHPTDSQILCTDLCASGEAFWAMTNDKYTYCCELNEFLTAFDLPKEVVGGGY